MINFLKNLPAKFKTKVVAFGMMRKKGKSASNDPGLNAVLNSGVSTTCLVGKSWDFHVKSALGISNSENLEMINDSINYASKRVNEVMFDSEHFFDGYKANPEYSLNVIKTAFDAGAKWIVLCDTNGGTLPFELNDIIEDVKNNSIKESWSTLFHNDTDNATYNSIESVRLGVNKFKEHLTDLAKDVEILTWLMLLLIWF